MTCDLVALGTPADDRNDMVHLLASLGHDATSVLEDWRSVDTTRDGATGHNFLGHVGRSFDGTILRDGGVRVGLNGTTEPTGWEGRAGTRDILVGAVPLYFFAEALLRFRGAGHVWVGCVVRDPLALLTLSMKPLIWAIDGASMARSDTATVENVLHGKVNIDSLTLARDLNAIAESRNGTVCPAGATILGDVLVKRLCEERRTGAVHVVPAELQ